ncbi:hypothetical protein GOV07_02895 [Candidatus Woesearchaeota archaeon]|nr:hypothetical protein [Candidatus Woesearchaeota archaeon]
MDPLEREVKKSYATVTVWTPDVTGYKVKDFLFPDSPFDGPHPMKHVYRDIFASTGLRAFYESFSRNAGTGLFTIGRASLRVESGIQPFLYMATLLKDKKDFFKKDEPGGELEELFNHVAEHTLAGKRPQMDFLKIWSVGWHFDD